MTVISRRRLSLQLLLLFAAGGMNGLRPVIALADEEGGEGGHGGGEGGDGHDGGGNDGGAGGDDSGAGAGAGGSGNGGAGGAQGDDDDDDHERAYAERRRGAMRPLSEVLDQVREVYGGRILDVKIRKVKGRPHYVVKVLDRQGRVREALVPAMRRKRMNFRTRKR